MILVRGSNIFLVKDCKSVDFSKEVYEFLPTVVILVRRSDIFEKSVDLVKEV